MKKFLPFVLIFVLAITGAVLAEAPYEIFVSITGSDSVYTTSVIGNEGMQIAIRLGEKTHTLTVGKKQAEGLNFSIDPALEFTDPQYGIATISSFLLPEGVTDEFAEIGPEKLTLTIYWEQMTLDPVYENLINEVTTVLQGGESDAEDFSVIFRFLSGMDAAKNAGFYITDLDNDGTPELLLGENQPGSNATVFYDLYTIENGELVPIFDGWDRSRYYLGENNSIIHEGSSSAFQSFTSLNFYRDGKLNMIESVIYDSNANADNPWRLSTISENQVNTDDQLLSEAEALYTISQYLYQSVALDPFID